MLQGALKTSFKAVFWHRSVRDATGCLKTSKAALKPYYGTARCPIGCLRPKMNNLRGFFGRGTVTKSLCLAQCGGVPGPGRQEAFTIALETTDRARKWHKSSSSRKQKKPTFLTAVLFDLEQAFNKVDRQRAFEVLAQRAQCEGLLDEINDGTCFMLKDAAGRIVRRVVLQKGVRQGSAEGPLVFVACYDLIPREASAIEVCG